MPDQEAELSEATRSVIKELYQTARSIAANSDQLSPNTPSHVLAQFEMELGNVLRSAEWLRDNSEVSDAIGSAAGKTWHEMTSLQSTFNELKELNGRDDAGDRISQAINYFRITSGVVSNDVEPLAPFASSAFNPDLISGNLRGWVAPLHNQMPHG